MEVFWGDGLGEETKGLDILGVRGLDQSLETALANGITTISLRGRYFTILPWLIGEFFHAEEKAGATAFEADRLRTFVGRVEYLTLACTVMDDSGGDPGGALGSVTFRDIMGRLRGGATIPFPKDRRGSILGTYFGPCRAIGLVKSAESGAAQPFSLTPRGKEIWVVRNAALGEGPLRRLLWEADALSPDDVPDLLPHFSLMGLRRASAEAACLRHVLQTAWVPSGGGASVAEAYERFAGTLAWLRAEAKSGPLQADVLLAANYRRTVHPGGGEKGITIAWAEFEWRRRLHFALELIFSGLCATLRARGQATLSEVVTEWHEAPDLPPVLTKTWPEVHLVWTRSGAEAVASVPDGFFLEEIPISALGSISPHARALAAFGLVAGLAVQSRTLRAASDFPERHGVGERALALLEGAAKEPFSQTLTHLAEIAAEAHLATTFRKMAAGQKCSLRFFPDGPRLRATGLPANAGQSGSRLENIIQVLADAGVEGVAEAA
jgi:hypothetical protein